MRSGFSWVGLVESYGLSCKHSIGKQKMGSCGLRHSSEANQGNFPSFIFINSISKQLIIISMSLYIQLPNFENIFNTTWCYIEYIWLNNTWNQNTLWSLLNPSITKVRVSVIVRIILGSQASLDYLTEIVHTEKNNNMRTELPNTYGNHRKMVCLP